MFKSESHREKLIHMAEVYQSKGEYLPVDLYAALMEQGVDASLYNQEPTVNEKEESHDH